MSIEKGMLWERLVATTERAVKTGALLPIPTNFTFVEEEGVRYFVRVLESLKRKDEARKKQDSAKTGKAVNPFLPPETDLTVGDITDNHIAILNKFNVMTHHLLIVTRHFEDQETLLTPEDFKALWFCLREYDSLGFYNGGREAGASQQHKHLQIVPLPLGPEGPSVPIQPLLTNVSAGRSRIAQFPFLHSFARINERINTSPADAAQYIYSIYCAMLKELGMRTPGPGRLTSQSMPYCLLITRAWMLLVPRSREHFEDVSLNSLAYAGSFFVRDQKQLERLRAFGFMNAMTAVAVPFSER